MTDTFKGILANEAAQQNKRELRRQAVEEQRLGVAQESRIRDAARQTMGNQIASQFSNGFQGGSGSALDALTESQIAAAMDALSIRRDAAGKAASLRAQAEFAKMQGRNAIITGVISDAEKAVRMGAGGGGDWAAARKGSSAGGG